MKFIKDAHKSAKENMQNVKLFNKEGIEKYSNGQLVDAQEMFEKALVIAPMNTGSALNLIQVLIALVEKVPKKKWEFLERCKAVHKIVDGMPIAQAHQKRFEELTSKFEKLLNKK